MYTAGLPSTSPFPARRGTSSDGPTATTARGSNGASAARATRADRPGDRDLPRRAEPEIEPAERPRERSRRPLDRRLDEAEDRYGPRLELVVAPETPEPQEHPGEHRVPGGHGRVLEVLRPGNARVAVGAREVEAAVNLVREELDGEQRESARFEEPADLAGRDVELHEAVRDVRVIVQEA